MFQASLHKKLTKISMISNIFIYFYKDKYKAN